MIRKAQRTRLYNRCLFTKVSSRLVAEFFGALIARSCEYYNILCWIGIENNFGGNSEAYVFHLLSPAWKVIDLDEPTKRMYEYAPAWPFELAAEGHQQRWYVTPEANRY
eukprot:2098440-Amphidinium_carterae.1